MQLIELMHDGLVPNGVNLYVAKALPYGVSRVDISNAEAFIAFVKDNHITSVFFYEKFGKAADYVITKNDLSFHGGDIPPSRLTEISKYNEAVRGIDFSLPVEEGAFCVKDNWLYVYTQCPNHQAEDIGIDNPIKKLELFMTSDDI